MGNHSSLPKWMIGWSCGRKKHGKNYEKTKTFQTNQRVIPVNFGIMVTMGFIILMGCSHCESWNFEYSNLSESFFKFLQKKQQAMREVCIYKYMQIQTRGEHLLQKSVLGGIVFHGQFRISRSFGCKNIWEICPIFNSSSLNGEESSCCVVSPRFKASGEA